MSDFSNSISGIQAAFFKQDVSAHNLANLNTEGYKAQQVHQSTDPAGGVQTSATGSSQAQGPLRPSQRQDDLAIQGEGHFILEIDGQERYTRVGTLGVDGEGNVVNRSNGALVKGYVPGEEQGEPKPLKIDAGTVSKEATATDAVQIEGNISADLETGEQVKLSADLFDSQGNQETAVFQFEKTGPNKFKLTTTDSRTGDKALVGEVKFDAHGEMEKLELENSPNTAEDFQGLHLTTAAGSEPIRVKSANFELSGLTQHGGESSAEVTDVSGNAAGRLAELNFDSRGQLTASYDNGEKEVVGQLALAKFRNPGGLSREAGGLLKESANSGQPRAHRPGSGGVGEIRPGFLEGSNVRPTEEIVNQLSSRYSSAVNVKALRTRQEMLGDLLDLQG